MRRPCTATRDESSRLRAFSSFGEWGLLAGCGAQATAGSSLAAEHRLPGPPALVTVARALSTGLGVVAHGLSCSEACGVFPNQGMNSCFLHWQADSLPLSHQGSPINYKKKIIIIIVGASLEAQWLRPLLPMWGHRFNPWSGN